MALKIHAVMQHAHDQNILGGRHVENHVGLLPDATKLGCDLLCTSAEMGVVEQGRKTSAQLVTVFARLALTKFGSGELRY